MIAVGNLVENRLLHRFFTNQESAMLFDGRSITARVFRNGYR